MEYIGEKELNNKLDEFKNHLEHTDRMILSARFGDGKSFFLQKVRENVVHKAYESLTPIQIAVYDDKLEIWNCGTLPEDWTLSNLLGKHRSHPYNPDIANVFFRAGEIEA